MVVARLTPALPLLLPRPRIAPWPGVLGCNATHTTQQVDAPRWGKTNMVIDNLDDIEPCRVDCDKDGGNTGTDFAFFGNMLALNVCASAPTCPRMRARTHWGGVTPPPGCMVPRMCRIRDEFVMMIPRMRDDDSSHASAHAWVLCDDDSSHASAHTWGLCVFDHEYMSLPYQHIIDNSLVI